MAVIITAEFTSAGNQLEKSFLRPIAILNWHSKIIRIQLRFYRTENLTIVSGDHLRRVRNSSELLYYLIGKDSQVADLTVQNYMINKKNSYLFFFKFFFVFAVLLKLIAEFLLQRLQVLI